MHDDSTLQAYSIIPVSHPTDSEYVVNFRVVKVPLQESEVRKELQEFQERDSRNVWEQVDSLIQRSAPPSKDSLL